MHGPYRIVTGDPEEALLLVAEGSPRLVLLDLVLAGRDGVELMGDVQATCRVPVVFLSVLVRDEVIAKVLEEGLPTTSSSPSRPRSWRPGYGRPCGVSGTRVPAARVALRVGRTGDLLFTWAFWPGGAFPCALSGHLRGGRGLHDGDCRPTIHQPSHGRCYNCNPMYHPDTDRPVSPVEGFVVATRGSSS